MPLLSLRSPSSTYTSSVPSALLDENGRSRDVTLHWQLDDGKGRLIIDEDNPHGTSWALVVNRDVVTCLESFLDAVKAHRDAGLA
jgi:hypothetical protein